jgi:hypothetical protein
MKVRLHARYSESGDRGQRETERSVLRKWCEPVTVTHHLEGSYYDIQST